MISALQHTGNAASAAMTTGQAHADTAQGRDEAGRAHAGTVQGRNETGQAHADVAQGRDKVELAHADVAQGLTEPHKDHWMRIAGDSTACSADSLQAGTADTLSFGEFGAAPADIPAELTVTPTPWRDTTAAALFGDRSVTIQPERLERPLSSPLTDNAVFQGFVLLLAATYATLLYRNLGDIRSLLNRISRDKTSGERLTEEPGSSGFARFLNLTTAIGILFMGVVVVKYGDSLMPPELGKSLSHGAVLALSLLATLAWGAVILFQAMTVRIIGAVTLSQPFIAQLVQLRQTFFSLAVIIASPALLLFALCPRGTGSVWFFVGAAELIITAVLYLKESLNLFISKKISILHWFLYLCTVEIFPISLLWLLAAR